MEYAPIVMFVYNRADHFRQTYEALARCPEAKDSALYIFSDGAKNEMSAPQVAAVREAAADFAARKDFKETTIVEAPENKGLARSVIDGVTDVINRCGSAIVLEDDCVAAPAFLTFMNAALQYYEDDDRVGSVAGYTPPFPFPAGFSGDVFAARRSCSCAWATWKDIWEQVDWGTADLEAFCRDAKLRKRLNSCGSDRFLRLYRQTVKNAESWSVRFGAYLIRKDLLTVYPRYSYISNIGCDETGVHSKAADAEKMRVDLEKAIPAPVLQPAQTDPAIQKALKKHYSCGSVSDLKRAMATKYVVLKYKIKKTP